MADTPQRDRTGVFTYIDSRRRRLARQQHFFGDEVAILSPLPLAYSSSSSFRVGLTDAQMTSLSCACDVRVHPDRGEGFGMPLAEAMACGLPVSATVVDHVRDRLVAGPGRTRCQNSDVCDL